MDRFSHFATGALACAVLAACGSPAPPPAPGAAAPTTPADRLRAIVERYWDDNAARAPWYSWGGSDLQSAGMPGETISPQALADSLDLERRYLAEVTAIPRGSLGADARLTYDLFRRERAEDIEGFTYPFELLPVNPFDGMPQQFALMAAAAEPRALSTAADYDRWSMRVQSLVSWTRQAIVNLQDGLRRGVTLPRVLVERSIPQLAALGADGPENVFFQPLPPAADAGPGADPERVRLRNAMTALLRGQVLPAYRTLHDFLERDYLPRSRTTVGWSALPLGEAWYAYRVRRMAGVGATPAQLHALGVSEVDRLQRVLRAILADAGFAGSAQDYQEAMARDPRFSYATADALMAACEDLETQTTAALPPLFSAPAAAFVIRRVEPFRRATAPTLSYRPAAPNGLTAPTLYVNTDRLEARPATAVAPAFLREAVPGIHYQVALQRARADLPRFRRFGVQPAFREGWGLYAQTLGEELGVYRDPQAKFGAALAELRCAAGLVVDTGLHAGGWTRAQALDYFQHQVPGDETQARLTVDRAIAMPADELACMAGYLKIQSLRAYARQSLGDRFELRAFHDELLRDGALPLDLLDARMRAWTAREVAAPPKAPEPAASDAGTARVGP